MRKIAIMALLSLPLFAGFFPQTIHTSISQVTGNSIALNHAFPINGMSGVVVHDYGNDLEAITSRVIQKSMNNVSLVKSTIIHHDNLPSINTSIKVGDKVIGGYLYDNVLLLAPDASTYAQITSTYNKKWVHPDLFALYLSEIGDSIPTKRNLASFAKKHQVGLVYIVGNGTAKLLDPISGKIVSKQGITNLPSKGEAPFFMRLDEIESGMFSSSNTKSYYKIMSVF